MRVATDARDALADKVKGRGREAGAGEEGDEEGAQTAVYMQGQGFSQSEA